MFTTVEKPTVHLFAYILDLTSIRDLSCEHALSRKKINTKQQKEISQNQFYAEWISSVFPFLPQKKCGHPQAYPTHNSHCISREFIPISVQCTKHTKKKNKHTHILHVCGVENEWVQEKNHREKCPCCHLMQCIRIHVYIFCLVCLSLWTSYITYEHTCLTDQTISLNVNRINVGYDTKKNGDSSALHEPSYDSTAKATRITGNVCVCACEGGGGGRAKKSSRLKYANEGCVPSNKRPFIRQYIYIYAHGRTTMISSIECILAVVVGWYIS